VPPNSCIPSRAKIRMKRKSSSSKDMMDFMELSNEMTRLRREDQYLKEKAFLKCFRFSQQRGGAVGRCHTT
jgi:hypothetical protein